MPVPTIDWKNDKLRIIDQSALPGKLKYINCESAESVWKVIRNMKIRGAPALGVAAAYGVYLGVRRTSSQFFKQLKKTVKYISTSRPTARNLFWALERMEKAAYSVKEKPIIQIKKRLLKEAEAILKDDKEICRKIGYYGKRLIKNGDIILTHCNAGGLATADYGTALGVIFASKDAGCKIKVFVDETRPVLQGARLTTWELMRENVDTTLISDNMAAYLMSKKRITKIIVGADRIATNGDTANKIGTYGLAVSANYHKIPFYVAAPLSTIDRSITSGKHIPIEERDPDEIRKIGNTYIAPKKVKVFNPAFDITPHGLISAMITEKGIIKKPYNRNIKKLFKK